MSGKGRIRVAGAIAATAFAALGVSSSAVGATAGIPELGDQPVATASGKKAQPKRCQGALQSRKIERYGLEVFTWAVCGRSGGVPFG